jgi:large repetitive protein
LPGDLAVGATVTITYAVTVNNPDTGDKTLTNTVASATPGSTCPSGSPNLACTAVTTVLIPGLAIANTASTSAPVPGSVVGYTLTITDTGQTAYTGATVTDTITPMLDNAAYDGDAAATAGGVSYASGVLTWTGTLAPGDTATVAFSVTVNNPDTGDKLLIATASSAAAGSTCPPGTTTTPCRSTVGVLTPALTITSTADASSTVPGATVGYTITITDTGQTPYAGVTVTAPLTHVLDDAAYNNDAAASTGTVSYASPTLTWTGSLASGDTATITYSVTVSNPDTGNHILASTVTSAATGNNCPVGSTDPRCTATVTVSDLVIDFTASAPTVTPGGALVYTATLTNTGQTPYFGISVNTDTTELSANATSGGNTTASSGTLSIGATGTVWTGNIPVGGTVTITSPVLVDNPVTSDTLTATAVSTAPGSNCPPGSADPRCTPVTQVLTPGLSIVTTANTTAAVPGQTVAVTVTVTDNGQIPYTAATVTDTLNLFRDATYNNDATATSGAVSYASPVITWTGDLAVGATATITYTVTVNNPDTGDKTLNTVAASTDAGSSCPPANSNAGCSLTIVVLTPALTIIKTASTATAAPGQIVTYRVTVTDSGQTPYTGAAFSDSLSGALADASYNNDATATTGAISYASPVITWTGDLTVGATATITYSVTVNTPDTGSQVLTNTITSATAGNNCPSGSTDPRCAVTVDISALTIVNSAGQTSYTGASVTDSLTGVVDDAAYNNDANTTAGSVRYASPNLTWTGDLAPGSTATVTFSVTVNTPDTGDKTLTSTVTSAAAGNNCPAGGTDPNCSTTVSVLTPALTITKTATSSTTTPGSTVGFTITVADTGQTPYSGITVTDPLSGVISDGVYNNDATATSGSVSYASPTLTWTGDLTLGEVVTISYSVTVNDPDTGGRILANAVVSSDPGSDCPVGSVDPSCTVTVPVMAGTLSMTAPVSADLGMTAPGGSASASLGTVQVTDTRGFGADWTATVSATGFTTGNGTAPETIPASDAFYDVTGFGSTTGSASFSFVPETNLSGDPQPIVSATNVGGDTSATWDPLIDVQVPATAIGGQYTATIVHSVS